VVGVFEMVCDPVGVCLHVVMCVCVCVRENRERKSARKVREEHKIDEKGGEKGSNQQKERVG
jgi:hypothetical protein